MDTQTIQALQGSVTGPIVTPGDPGYDEARKVYNYMIDRHPAAVVSCRTADDVAAVVRQAAQTGTELAVRGGAHSVPGFGTADDALVVDLSGLSSVTVDPSSRTARVGGGATWGAFNDATGAFGLATTGGLISTTGVGGLTLGGGIGYLSRAYGLSCDNLLAAQVVTADGLKLTTSDAENPDLFWALRGGGGNFGVVTEFTFRLHPVAQIYGGPMFFELSDGKPCFPTSTSSSRPRHANTGASPRSRSRRPCRSSPRTGSANPSSWSCPAGLAPLLMAKRSCNDSGMSPTPSRNSSGRCRTRR